MLNNSRRLEIAEYVSLVGSVAGSVVAALSGQVIYVAIPLSASVIFNSINRRRSEILTKQITNAAITRLQRQISGELQSLYASASSLPSSPESVRFNSHDVQEVVATSIRANLNPIYHDVAELKEQCASLQDSLTSVVHI